MSCIVGCGRVLIVVINIIFLILGLALFVAGLIARFGMSALESYYKPVLDSMTADLSSNGFGDVDTSSFDIEKLVGGLAIFLILLGLFLIIITILGCCGACCKVKVMLIVYAIIVIVILVGEAIFVGILYGKPNVIKDDIKEPLKNGIKNDYIGFNGTNIVSLGWNFAHRQWKCCGVDGYTDFTGATQWLTDYGVQGTLKAPITCCTTIPSSSDLSCATTPLAYYTDGCFDEVYNLLLGNMALVLGVVGGCAAFQLLLIILAIVIFVDAREKVSPR